MGVYSKREFVAEESSTPIHSEFQFADKTQQLIRSNRFMAVAVTAYF